MLSLWLFYLSLSLVFAVQSVGAVLPFPQASCSQYEGSLPSIEGSGHLPGLPHLPQGSRVTLLAERSLNAQLSSILPSLCEKVPSWSTPPTVRFTGLSPHGANLEPVHCSMSSSNCCFLTCIQVSQEEGKVVWYFCLFKKIPVCCDPHSQRL